MVRAGHASETYFSTRVYDYNMLHGWNIEHATQPTIWVIIRLEQRFEEYVMKDLFLNVRLYMRKSTPGSLTALEKCGYHVSVDPTPRPATAFFIQTAGRPLFSADPRIVVIGRGVLCHEYLHGP